MENEEIIVKEEIEDILPDNFETASTSSSAAHLKRSASHLLDDSISDEKEFVHDKKNMVASSSTKGGKTCHNCQNLGTKFQELKDMMNIVINQNKAIMTVQEEHTVQISKLLKEESANNRVFSEFPIKDLEEMARIDQELTEFNRLAYEKAFRVLLRGKLSKSLNLLMTTDVLLLLNVEGTHGKKRLKDFQNIYELLLDIINGPEPEKVLRTAICIIKKRHFHKVCLAKKSKKE